MRGCYGYKCAMHSKREQKMIAAVVARFEEVDKELYAERLRTV